VLTITPAVLTVTADAQTKVYGSADPVLSYQASGFQFGDTAGSVLTGGLVRAAGETVAGGPYAITQGSLAANSNYSIAFTGNVLTITPSGLVSDPPILTNLDTNVCQFYGFPTTLLAGSITIEFVNDNTLAIVGTKTRNYGGCRAAL